jgi:hypothetical protein
LFKGNFEPSFDSLSASSQHPADLTIGLAENSLGKSSSSIVGREAQENPWCAQLQTMVRLDCPSHDAVGASVLTGEHGDPWTSPVPFGRIPCSNRSFEDVWGMLVWSHHERTVPDGYKILGFISCRGGDQYIETRDGDFKSSLVSQRSIRSRFNLTGRPTFSRNKISSCLSEFPQRTSGLLSAHPTIVDSDAVSQSSASKAGGITDQEPSVNPAGSTSRSVPRFSSDQGTASSYTRPG